MNQTRLLALLPLLPLLAGCTTSELAVEYPLEPTVVSRINGAGGTATILLGDGQEVSASSLRVDSVLAVWLGDGWTALPLADIACITIPDREGEEGRLMKGILYGSAGVAALALAGGLIEGTPNIAGTVIGAAAAGGLIAGLWLPQTEWSFVQLSLRPPADEAARVRRAADRQQLQGRIPEILAGLQEEHRRYRIEPGFLFGRGNGLSSESDPASLFAVGGRMSFGYRIWKRTELAFEFSLVSHMFDRRDAREQVTRGTFLLTGTFYPFPQSTLFLQTGLGYGFYSASGTYAGSLTTDPPVSPPLVSGDGPAVAFGTGVDVDLTEQWSLRPAIRYTFVPLGDLTLNDTLPLASGKGSHFLAFSLGLVFRGI